MLSCIENDKISKYKFTADDAKWRNFISSAYAENANIVIMYLVTKCTTIWWALCNRF